MIHQNPEILLLMNKQHHEELLRASQRAYLLRDAQGSNDDRPSPVGRVVAAIAQVLTGKGRQPVAPPLQPAALCCPQ